MKIDWKLKLSIGLVGLSAVLYGVHYICFRDIHHILLYLVGDIAFIPIDVLLVTLVIHQIITRHEKAVAMKKMYMVIGAFFSETGTQLLRFLVSFDRNEAAIRDALKVGPDWDPGDFERVAGMLGGFKFDLHADSVRLGEVRNFLLFQRQFLLGLLENPILLEHEKFTALLWAVFHLTEELSARPGFDRLPAADLDHLTNDIKRVYRVLITEWLMYMRHLQKEYPYLFSLAMRTNPFNPAGSAVIDG